MTVSPPKLLQVLTIFMTANLPAVTVFFFFFGCSKATKLPFFDFERSYLILASDQKLKKVTRVRFCSHGDDGQLCEVVCHGPAVRDFLKFSPANENELSQTFNCVHIYLG